MHPAVVVGWAERVNLSFDSFVLRVSSCLQVESQCEVSGIPGAIGTLRCRASLGGRGTLWPFCFGNSGWIVWHRTPGYSSCQVVPDLCSLARSMTLDTEGNVF